MEGPLIKSNGVDSSSLSRITPFVLMI
jgi:hypothetical protein